MSGVVLIIFLFLGQIEKRKMSVKLLPTTQGLCTGYNCQIHFKQPNQTSAAKIQPGSNVCRKNINSKYQTLGPHRGGHFILFYDQNMSPMLLFLTPISNNFQVSFLFPTISTSILLVESCMSKSRWILSWSTLSAKNPTPHVLAIAWFCPTTLHMSNIFCKFASSQISVKLQLVGNQLGQLGVGYIILVLETF